MSMLSTESCKSDRGQEDPGSHRSGDEDRSGAGQISPDRHTELPPAVAPHQLRPQRLLCREMSGKPCAAAALTILAPFDGALLLQQAGRQPSKQRVLRGLSWLEPALGAKWHRTQLCCRAFGHQGVEGTRTAPEQQHCGGSTKISGWGTESQLSSHHGPKPEQRAGNSAWEMHTVFLWHRAGLHKQWACTCSICLSLK